MAQSRKYRELSFSELVALIENLKSDRSFNALGFYRSLLEHKRITLEEAVNLRDLAHKTLQKAFDFLQLKDPETYFNLTMLGVDYTKGDEQELWRLIKENQQAILKEKQVRHRNFGTYSKHDCGYDWCPYKGLMIHQGSALSQGSIHFKSDKHPYNRRAKSEQRRRDRKHFDKRKELDQVLQDAPAIKNS